jgi:hypothetical protein
MRVYLGGVLPRFLNLFHLLRLHCKSKHYVIILGAIFIVISS